MGFDVELAPGAQHPVWARITKTRSKPNCDRNRPGEPYDFLAQETALDITPWTCARVAHCSEQAGNAVLRCSQSRQGLLTRCPTSKSNLHLKRFDFVCNFIISRSFLIVSPKDLWERSACRQTETAAPLVRLNPADRKNEIKPKMSGPNFQNGNRRKSPDK